MPLIGSGRITPSTGAVSYANGVTNTSISSTVSSSSASSAPAAVTTVNTGVGLGGGPITGTGTIYLVDTTVRPGTYIFATITVDPQGRITEASNGSSGVGLGSVTSVASGTGLTGGPVTGAGTIALANTAVTPGTYSFSSIVVDQQGRITSAASGATSSGVVSLVASTGLTGGTVTSTGTIALANTTVLPGTYSFSNIVVDQQGRITFATSGTAGSVTSVASGTGLTGGPFTTAGTIALANTTVTPGTYSFSSIVVDQQGRITSATSGAAGSGITSLVASTGLTGGTVTSTGTIALANTTVTPGTYSFSSIVVDQQGRITSATSGAAGTGSVTSVATGTGLSGGPFTTAGTIALANTAVTPGTYSFSSIVVDQQGRITSATSGAAGTGSVTSVATGTGLSGGPFTTAGTIALANTAVTPGTYTVSTITVDQQGRVTAASSGSAVASYTLTVTNTYTTSGAVATTDNLALFNSASALTMTLGSGTDGHQIVVKRFGSGTATLTATIDGVASTSILMNSVSIKESVTLVWNASNATWLLI